MEVKIVISGSRNIWECTKDEIQSMARLYQYLGYGWRAGGEDQEMILNSLLGTTL